MIFSVVHRNFLQSCGSTQDDMQHRAHSDPLQANLQQYPSYRIVFGPSHHEGACSSPNSEDCKRGIMGGRGRVITRAGPFKMVLDMSLFSLFDTHSHHSYA